MKTIILALFLVTINGCTTYHINADVKIDLKSQTKVDQHYYYYPEEDSEWKVYDFTPDR